MRNTLMFCFCGFMAAFHIIVIQAALCLGEPVGRPIMDASIWMAAAIWFALMLDEQCELTQKESEKTNG